MKKHTQAIIFALEHTRNNQINFKSIERSKQIRYLGIVLDRRINIFNEHVKYVIDKTHIRVYFYYRRYLTENRVLIIQIKNNYILRLYLSENNPVCPEWSFAKKPLKRSKLIIAELRKTACKSIHEGHTTNNVAY